MRCPITHRHCKIRTWIPELGISKWLKALNLLGVHSKRMETHNPSNIRSLSVTYKNTFLNGLGYDFFFPKSSCLEHFLETNNIIILNCLQNIIQSLILIVILVCLDRWGPHKNIICEQLQSLRFSLHKPVLIKYTI